MSRSAAKAVLAPRARVAQALDRVGLAAAILAARARAVLPWRWLTVLAYHRVAPPGTLFDPDVVDATPAEFEQHVTTLARYFTLVDTRALDRWRQGEPLPPNPAILTFDDGYRDNHDLVLPILRRHGVSATFFVATAYVSSRRLFWWEKARLLLARARRARVAIAYPEPLELDLSSNVGRERATERVLRLIKDRPGLDVDRLFDAICSAADVRLGGAEERALADELIMSWDHERALRAAGMDVQSHGHEHRVLGTLPMGATERDLATARDRLEAELDAPVHAVAYPAGRGLTVAPALRTAIARAGYRLGFTCGTGIGRIGPRARCDWLDLRRVSVDAKMSRSYLRGCLAVPALAY